MKKVFLAGFVVLCFVVGQVVGAMDWNMQNIAPSEEAIGPERDQHQNSESGAVELWAGHYIAQTFVCGMGGQLACVNIYGDTWTGEPPSFPMTLSVVETVGGTPTGSVLGAVSVPSITLGWFAFDFTPQSVILSEGTQYAIIVSSDDPSVYDPSDAVAVQWHNDSYVDGELWHWTPATEWEEFDPVGNIGDADMAFETWMVPEPTTLALFAFGSIALLRKRK